MLQQRKTHHQVRYPFSPRSIRDLAHIFDQTRDVQERRNRTHLLRFLVNHHGRAYTTIRVTTARDLTPIGTWSVDKIGEIGERSHQ